MAHFVEKWEEITDNKWVLSIVRHGFRIPFSKIPPLSSVPIRMSQSSSPENLLNKRAVERVQNPGTPGFYSRIFLVPKKERKVTFDYRPFFIEPIHRETVFQNGDSQVSKTSDETQRLGCLHRFNRCISSHSDTSSIPEVPSIRLQRSGISLHALPFGMSLSPLIFSKLMDVIAAFLRQRAISVLPYLDDWLIKDLIRNRLISQTRFCIKTIQRVSCQT